MKNTKCEECGAEVKWTYEPAYQEYRGASVQGGYHYGCCQQCGWDDIQKGDLSDFNFRENTRGW